MVLFLKCNKISDFVENFNKLQFLCVRIEKVNLLKYWRIQYWHDKEKNYIYCTFEECNRLVKLLTFNRYGNCCHFVNGYEYDNLIGEVNEILDNSFLCSYN